MIPDGVSEMGLKKAAVEGDEKRKSMAAQEDQERRTAQYKTQLDSANTRLSAPTPFPTAYPTLSPTSSPTPYACAEAGLPKLEPGAVCSTLEMYSSQIH